MSTTGPTTALHYAANGNFDSNGVYAAGADGFNLADVGSVSELDSLPAGDKGLVYLGMTDGVTAAFTAAVDSYIGDPKLYGFYLVDEPDGSATTAANLKAEADYIAAHVPGAISYMTEQNLSADTTPSFYYTPANTDINLFGLDPYPVNTNVPNGLDYNIIPTAVAAAEKAGIPLADIVPVYQAFGGGGYTTYGLPSAAQAQQILATWGAAVPNPAFDYAYSWGTQESDTALSNDPTLAAVFAAHNASSGTTPTTPAPVAPTVAITSAGGTMTQAAQTITGTVDVADAGSTVNLLDGTTQVGTATVGSTGAWSAKVTLNQGANVLTATDTNATGTGTSKAITDTLTASTPTPVAPTVAITSAGGAMTQAAQTIAGTVDVADAGSTVKLLDGTTQVATATVGATGAWSANVTLNQGANVLTATDTNATGTGKSSAITDTLTASAPTPPTSSTLTLAIADSTLHVSAGGGTVGLGITETAPSSATAASITITGLPRYETITDGLGDTFSGGRHGIKISEAQVNSGLTLTSNYQGTSDPTATLQITANDTVAGVASHSAAQTLTVIDPPATSTAASTTTTGQLALLNQYIAGGFDHHSGGAPLMSNVAASFAHDDSFLTSSRHA